MTENYIAQEPDAYDLALVEEFRQKGMLPANHLELMTYDLVQLGYPRPEYGGMVARPFSGSDEKGVMITGKGAWMKTEDVLKYIQTLKSQLDVTNIGTVSDNIS